MPIFMDVHSVPGVKARDVAEAHRKDLLIQEEHECKCITYWIDEERENIFCLIEAPSKDAVNTMHGRAHGLIPNRIIEVDNDLVHSFLGRIYDPDHAEITTDGLKVFKDSSFRVLMVVKVPDSTLMKYKLGADEAQRRVTACYAAIRRALECNEGREVEDKGPGFIASFSSAPKAVLCALNVIDAFSNDASVRAGFKIGISAGDPVANSDKLFGETIQQATHMCEINKEPTIVITAEVGDLITKDLLAGRQESILTLTPKEESLLNSLYKALEENWHNANFNVAELCDAMAMSKSRLYRKTIGVCGTSTISLLKDFRLEKAKMLMRKQRYNISEITFASGFTSPSYFTKCFKKKYGLLPMAYVDLLH